MSLQPTVLGSTQHDQISGTETRDVIVGLAGDDTIEGRAGADVIHSDVLGDNLLAAPSDANSLSQYIASGAWTQGGAPDAPTMSQTVETIAGARYEVSFEHAANYASGYSAATVTVYWDGEEIGQIDTSSGVFAEASFAFTGTGLPTELTFKVTPATDPDAPEIFSDGPVSSYEKTFIIDGQAHSLKAFAEGQAKIYQVMDGKLQVFDPETETYTPAGAEATVVVNAIGFNAQDDMIYGIAVKAGVDALGNAVAPSDLVMYDAEGHAYRIGATPYRSWTGDFDADGNLWYFEADFDRVTMVDVDQLDAEGNPLCTTFKFPKEMITDKVWDVAFDAASQSFFGLVRPSAEGAETKLFQIDISQVAAGGAPAFSTMPVTQTVIDGAAQEGAPLITFGAFMIDGDGNLYAGGNGGDHDMDDTTGTSGAIYRVERQADGTAQLVLVSDAPKAYSNDGAVDARAMDPFNPIDPSAVALIRGPELYAVEDPAQSYDDLVEAGAGADEVHGGYGQDALIGASAGDTLHGDTGDDTLYGGAGAEKKSWIESFYDEAGLRYDQFGTLLHEDDDVLFGGAGADFLDGSAGHDALDGGAANDTLSGGSGHDTLSGGAGDDTLSGGRQDDVLSGGTGDDTLNGGSGSDSLSGGTGRDVLHGGSGDDALWGGEDADSLDGGAGNDVLDGGAGDDYIKAGSGDDLVFAGDGNDYVNASWGDDQIDGGAGKDRIYMGAGADIATGGDGSDRFVFRLEDMDGSHDTITDFTRDGSQSDRLDFRGLDLLQGLDAAEWLASNVTQDANGDVTIALLNDTVLICEAHSPEDDILQAVQDGIMF
jgi:Ca2+-binding RTX toxin-like protein